MVYERNARLPSGDRPELELLTRALLTHKATMTALSLSLSPSIPVSLPSTL